jgi:hypothetical protein
MTLRFRKSFKLAPGVRLNVGSSGMSWTVGPRGASVNIGKRGAYLNAGIPGTGISARIPLSAQANRSGRPQSPAARTTVQLALELGDDGVLRYLDQDRRPVDEAFAAQARRQHGSAIRQFLEQKCAHLNDSIEALAKLHIDTPRPGDTPSYSPMPLAIARPILPPLRSIGFFARLIPGRRDAIETENRRRQGQYHSALLVYEAEQASLQLRNADLRKLHSAAMAGNPEQMQQLLEQRLGEIIWPKETAVAVEVSADGRQLSFDVDLPEIEHMPTKRAVLGARAWDLSLRDTGEQANRRLYMQHIHSIGFRLIGEAFAALPTVQHVVFSGYSQRLDRASGHIQDEYLYSVRVSRAEWSTLNFASLGAIDATDALSRFDMMRKMSSTGIFKPITPFTL